MASEAISTRVHAVFCTATLLTRSILIPAQTSIAIIKERKADSNIHAVIISSLS
jgi:hypothetical protein